jgi:uncharacterized protein YjdB
MRRRPLPLVLLVLAAACGGDSSTSPPDPEVVERVTVSPASATVEVAATVQLSVEVVGDRGSVLTGRTVTWSSSSGAATVSSAGLVSGVEPGSAVITATVEGVSGTATISVVPPPVASVTVEPASDTVVVGETVTLTATPRAAGGAPVEGASVSWSSRDPDIATVDADGEVTGVAPGEVVVDATSQGVGGSATVVVRPRPVAVVQVSPSTDTVRVDEQVTLSVAVLDDQGAESEAAVSWSSDDPSVATVTGVAAAAGSGAGPGRGAAQSGTAVVDGIAPGTTIVRATAQGVEGTATVVVRPQPVASVEVEPASPTLRLGATATLSATPRTAAGSEVAGCQLTWTVADEGVAGVSPAGELTATGVGETEVSAAAECGDAGTAQGTAPVTVDPPRVLAAATGRSYSCALVEDLSLGQPGLGRVWCWGANEHGQVGDGTLSDRSTPTLVELDEPLGRPEAPGDDPARRTAELLVMGDEHACALGADGATWCWGDGNNAQLGDGAGVDRRTPVRVSGGHEFVSLAAGEEFTCGVDADGQAWCWGQGNEGQLGYGAVGDRTTPTAVTGGHTWAFLRAGEDQVCGIDTDGDTWCWGDNSEGSVGDGIVGGNRLAPTRVVGPAPGEPAPVFDWLGIAEEAACGLEAATGIAWCWGRNDQGQLGQGTTGSPRARPGRVDPPNNTFRTLFDSGDDEATTMCGIAASAAPVGGPAFCWGGNAFGQLGDGTFQNRPLPTPLATDQDLLHINIGESHGCGITTGWSLLCWGDDRRGELGNGPPLQARPTPGLVELPPAS